MSTTATLSARNLVKIYEQESTEIAVLKGVTTHFSQGNTYVIMGSSGAGKSTLLHLLAGLDEPTSGSVLFNDRPLSSMSEHEKNTWLNKSVGLLFQQPYLIKELSVLENVMLKGLIAGMPHAECAHKARVLLGKVGLVDKADSRTTALSGGQQARVALARALLMEPLFLLADEPTGNLDEHTAQVIIELLLECQQLWHMGLIISSHDAYVANRMQATLRLQNGLLLAD